MINNIHFHFLYNLVRDKQMHDTVLTNYLFILIYQINSKRFISKWYINCQFMNILNENIVLRYFYDRNVLLYTFMLHNVVIWK